MNLKKTIIRFFFCRNRQFLCRNMGIIIAITFMVAHNSSFVFYFLFFIYCEMERPFLMRFCRGFFYYFFYSLMHRSIRRLPFLFTASDRVGTTIISSYIPNKILDRECEIGTPLLENDSESRDEKPESAVTKSHSCVRFVLSLTSRFITFRLFR